MNFDSKTVIRWVFEALEISAIMIGYVLFINIVYSKK